MRHLVKTDKECKLMKRHVCGGGHYLDGVSHGVGEGGNVDGCMSDGGGDSHGSDSGVHGGGADGQVTGCHTEAVDGVGNVAAGLDLEQYNVDSVSVLRGIVNANTIVQWIKRIRITMNLITIHSSGCPLRPFCVLGFGPGPDHARDHAQPNIG